MLKLILIRHFATEGNQQKKYIGITDEPLCEVGKQILQETSYPVVDFVFASPMKRCVETAKLIYPNHIPILYQGFAECNFGDFENKNFMELSDNLKYQAWIDSNGTLTFPNGENPKDFKARCIKAFEKMIRTSLKSGYKTVALIAHGGTIMSILEKYAYSHEDYYYWQVGNGNGYYAEMKENDWRLTSICTIH